MERAFVKAKYRFEYYCTPSAKEGENLLVKNNKTCNLRKDGEVLVRFREPVIMSINYVRPLNWFVGWMV